MSLARWIIVAALAGTALAAVALWRVRLLRMLLAGLAVGALLGVFHGA